MHGRTHGKTRPRRRDPRASETDRLYPSEQDNISSADWTGKAGHSLCHGQGAGAGVLELEVLVSELLAVDGFAAGAVATREVATLDHEVCASTATKATRGDKRNREPSANRQGGTNWGRRPSGQRRGRLGVHDNTRRAAARSIASHV